MRLFLWALAILFLLVGISLLANGSALYGASWLAVGAVCTICAWRYDPPRIRMEDLANLETGPIDRHKRADDHDGAVGGALDADWD